MHTHFRATSRRARFLTVVASCVVTTVLFGAVVIGLTGEQPWGQLALEAGHGAPAIASA